MKILILATHLNTGGITSYLWTLCLGLRKKGHQIWLVSSGGEKEKQFKQLGVHVINKNIMTKSDLSPKLFLAVNPIKKIIEENDIQIIHANTRVTQVLANMLQNKTGRVFISTCHGFFKTRISRRIGPCWGDAVIAISQPVFQHLIDDFKLPSDRIALIENGIDMDQFLMMPMGERTRFKHELNLPDEPIIGIIARLSDVKGIDVLINAMPKVLKQIPILKLLIAGQGKEEAALAELVVKLKLEEEIIFLPSVSNISDLLNSLDIFVMPSRQEGLGLSVMEAQACGCPVVASRVGGLVSLIEDGKTGLLVEPDNPDDLAEKLLVLLRDELYAKKIGHAGREFAENNYGSEKMIEKTENLYARLLV